MKAIIKISIISLFFIGFTSCGDSSKEIPYEEEVKYATAEFVGSASCMECHQDEFEKWKGSHHDLAMQIADSTTVLANFNTSFTYKKVENQFFIKGDEFFVNTQGPDGAYHDYKIEYTFGVTPLQQYIVKFPDGAYQCLQTAWDTEKKIWFDLQPDLDIKHEEWIHWSGGGMRWNTMCADCHSTNVHKNYDDKTNSFNTTYDEINSGCESCHGPSSIHVAYYKGEHQKGTPPKMYMDTTTKGNELVEKCARCHSRRSQLTNNFDFKEGYLDHYSPSLINAPNYELDGQIKGEVYVYGSFVQSKMYHNGVSCKDCHDVHSLKLKAEGNQLCMSCHEPQYDSEAHHFHKGNTAGTQCVNCHMVGQTYMGNDLRRDHSFRIPRPDQSVKFGTPNACIQCHKDKTNEWASDVIVKNYGEQRDDHFSDHLLAGYFGDDAALLKLIGNKKYPATARATAVNYYASQQLTENELLNLVNYLKDSSPLVRREIINGFERNAFVKGSNYIQPLLMDSIRSVRIAAASFYSNIKIENPNNLSQQEYLNMLNINADFAAGQLQIALYQQAQGNVSLAITAYRKSIKMDNYYNQSRMNLALLLYQGGNTDEAEKLYLKVVETEPNFNGSYYMLGLLYNEKGNITKAKEYLAKACEADAPNMNAFYNYSLILQGEGAIDESLKIIEKGLKAQPQNEKLLHLKLITLAQQNQLDDAYKICLKLLQISPNNPEYLDLQKRLKR